MAVIADAHMENCCDCELTMANLEAVFQPYGYVGFCSGSNPGICTGCAVQDVNFLTSEITAHDGFGNSFHQVVKYGRHNGAIISGTVRTNSDGTTLFNVDTHSFGGMTLVDCGNDFARWEWDFDSMGVSHGLFEIQLSDPYDIPTFKIDLDDLYSQKTLDDVLGGDVLHLTWQRDASWGLPTEVYGDTGLEWDSYDGRTLSADAKVLVQVLDHPGSVHTYALAERGGVAGGSLSGLIVRGLGSTQHCYEEYEVTPPNITCVEIDADGSHVVRLQPDEVDMGDATIDNVERYSLFKAHSLPSSSSPGCSCVPL